jgi:hypothetical protein
MVARRNQGLNFHQMGWQDLRSGIRFWPLIPKAGETGCHIPQHWGTEGAYARKSCWVLNHPLSQASYSSWLPIQIQ